MSGPIGGVAAGGGAAGVRDIIALRQQIIDRSSLLQQLHAPASGAVAAPTAQTGAPGAPAAPASGFSNALQDALHSVSATQNQAEQVTDAYQRGDVTDVSQVMLAREKAGVAFEATLQVKSKLLNAYQDIMRMGV
jgi:flagellar hook-basal body complex protein FliE